MGTWILMALGALAFVVGVPLIAYILEWIRYHHGPAYTVMYDVAAGPDQTIWVRSPAGELCCLSMDLKWPLIEGHTMHFGPGEPNWIDVNMEVNHQ